MKVAVVAFAPRELPNFLVQARSLLTCAACFAPQQVELWLLGDLDENTEKNISLSVDAVCQVAPGELGRVYTAEEWIPALERLYRLRRPQVVLFHGNLSGSELTVRLGVRLGGSFMTEITEVAFEENGVTQNGVAQNGVAVARSVYGANLKAVFALNTEPYVLSTAKGAFTLLASAPFGKKQENAILPEWVVLNERMPAWRVGPRLHWEETETGFETARIVVAGGRGVGGVENMERLRRIAALLGGKLGGTRPAVLDGWLRHKDLIGASGNVTQPKLCLSMGASGSGPFMAGVEKSRILAAVNSDPDALIFKYSDFGVVDDCNAVAQELERLLTEERPGLKGARM
ncbi:MAG: FAD-binding protein [Synergistaceae bacterium]|jgi:electron transfer flavoprotein alpha subunit|nr:FAD-binding protein [Synergistaceae bacterium]